MNSPSVIVTHPANNSRELDLRCLEAVHELIGSGYRTVVYLTGATSLVEELVESGAEVRISPNPAFPTDKIRSGRPLDVVHQTLMSGAQIWKSLASENPRFIVTDSRILPLWTLVAAIRGYPTYRRQECAYS